MVRLMPETTPERLYRPDVSITAWRRLCEQARDFAAPRASPDAPAPIAEPEHMPEPVTADR
jgi:hypothetical protein